MRRREFLGGAAALVVPAIVQAQDRRLPRLGVLVGTGNPEQHWRRQAVADGLRRFGWVTGQNVEVAFRWAEGNEAAAARLSEELVALEPRVLFASNTFAALALKRATASIPIIFTNVTDPIGTGLVQSFANPGGNITGFTDMDGAVAGKWVALLKELTPSLPRVVMMFNPETAPFAKAYESHFEFGAQRLSMEFGYHAIRTRDDYALAVKRSSEARAGMVIVDDALFNANVELVNANLVQARVPSINNHAAYLHRGGLMAYGIDVFELWKDSMSYVHRALSGANPRDLPVQMPTAYRLTMNLKTAQALGLTIPPTLLARADEVIE